MKSEMKIRLALESDSEELSEMICENANAMLRPHYSKEQWDIFITYYSTDVIRNKIAQQIVFCSEINGRIVGTVALDNDFVVGFYTRLDCLNQGVGSAMMGHLESFAAERGLKEVQLAASPGGLAFYLKNGWEKVKNIIIDHYGVGFEETLMVKRLTKNGEGETEYLFSYGTLQTEPVQLKTFGRKLHGQADCLVGYSLSLVKINDEAVVASSGLTEHPIIRPTHNAGDVVNGTVFAITKNELHQADLYEVDDYKRIEVQLKSGRVAWVFIRA